MMMKLARLACIGVTVAGIGVGYAESGRAADRFEVTSIIPVSSTSMWIPRTVSEA